MHLPLSAVKMQGLRNHFCGLGAGGGAEAAWGSIQRLAAAAGLAS